MYTVVLRFTLFLSCGENKMTEIGHKIILTLVTMTILADSGKTELKTGFEIVDTCNTGHDNIRPNLC